MWVDWQQMQIWEWQRWRGFECLRETVKIRNGRIGRKWLGTGPNLSFCTTAGDNFFAEQWMRKLRGGKTASIWESDCKIISLILSTRKYKNLLSYLKTHTQICSSLYICILFSICPSSVNTCTVLSTLCLSYAISCSQLPQWPSFYTEIIKVSYESSVPGINT